MATQSAMRQDILADENSTKREEIVQLLTKAYWMELETVIKGVDPVTNDMVIQILGDEQSHRRLFEGFLREFEA